MPSAGHPADRRRAGLPRGARRQPGRPASVGEEPRVGASRPEEGAAAARALGAASLAAGELAVPPSGFSRGPPARRAAQPSKHPVAPGYPETAPAAGRPAVVGRRHVRSLGAFRRRRQLAGPGVVGRLRGGRGGRRSLCRRRRQLARPQRLRERYALPPGVAASGGVAGNSRAQRSPEGGELGAAVAASCGVAGNSRVHGSSWR